MTTSAAQPTRIIAFMNQKGGVGKTTTTVNLGAALSELGSKVLFIDLDPQAHLTLHLGVDPTDLDASVYDLLVDDETTAESVLLDIADGMALLPSEVDLAAAEQELGALQHRHHVLGRKIKALAKGYDFVLLDCPPSLGMLTLNALTAANEVIVPMQAHFLALQGLSKLLETVQLVRQNMNTQLRVSGVVLCVHEGNTNLASEVVNDLQGFFQASRKLAMPWSNAVIYQPPIRRNIKLAECPSFGQTIMQYDAACAGAQDYRNLGKAVAGVTDTPKPAAAPVADTAPVQPKDKPTQEPAPESGSAEHSQPTETETPFTEDAVDPAPDAVARAEHDSKPVNADPPAAESPVAPPQPQQQPAQPQPSATTPQSPAAPTPPQAAPPKANPQLLRRLANPYSEIIRPALDTRIDIPPPSTEAGPPAPSSLPRDNHAQHDDAPGHEHADRHTSQPHPSESHT